MTETVQTDVWQRPRYCYARGKGKDRIRVVLVSSPLQ